MTSPHFNVKWYKGGGHRGRRRALISSESHFFSGHPPCRDLRLCALLETIVAPIRTYCGNLPIVRPPLHNIYGIYPSNEWPSLSTRASQQAFRIKHHWTGSPRIVCHIGRISQTHDDMMIKNGCMTSWSIRILLLVVNLVRLVPWGDFFLSYSFVW